MRDTKYRMESLCIYDYRAVEAHLSTMAAKGWRLEKAGNPFWKYRRAEPAEIRYAVTYSDGASQFNPRPTEGQQSLAELCETAGWEKVCDWFQMQIFCTQDPRAVPLETDEAIRLENVHRSMRKNFLPSSFVLLAVGLFMSWSFLGTLFTDPLHILERNTSLLTGPLFVLVALLEIYTLCHYYGWRRRSLRSIAEGGPCAPIRTRTYQRLNQAGLILTGVFFLAYLVLAFTSTGRSYGLFSLLYLALFSIVIALVRGTTALLRRRGVSKGKNIAGTLAVDVVLAFAMIGGLTWAGIHFGWFTGGSGETYTYQHLKFDVHPREDVPLTLTDLTGEDYRHTRRELRSEGSFFLPGWSYREYALQNTEQEDGDAWPGSLHLTYAIREPRGRWLYDALAEDLLAEEEPSVDFPEFDRVYRQEDPAPWGAEAAYRQYYRLDGDATDDWLLCWPGRIVLLSLDWPPTDREKAVIREHLSAEA